MTKTNKSVITGAKRIDDEQWGNIQLPGYTDEELHNPKLLKILTNKQRAGDPEFQLRCKEAALKIREKKSKAATKAWQEDSGSRKKAAAEVCKRVGFAKRSPIKTPLGLFKSRIEAADAHNITPQALCYHIKNHPDQYYYISHEDYQKLQGNS
jgi:hypothetical protein